MAMYSQGCSQVVKRVQTGQIAGLTQNDPNHHYSHYLTQNDPKVVVWVILGQIRVPGQNDHFGHPGIQY